MIPLVLGKQNPIHSIMSQAFHMTKLLTSGLSDAFAGGFLAGIVEEKSLEQSIDMGHWLASLSIKELGPQYVIPPLLFALAADTSETAHVQSGIYGSFTYTPYHLSILLNVTLNWKLRLY